MPAWDNVQLAGPPNGPAWVQAAAQMMNTVGNQVGSLGDAYQSGKNFNYQQKQRNFFQDPNNQAALQQALPQNQYSALIQSLLQAGGTPAIGQASQLIPTLQRQQLIDQYINENGGGGQPPLQTGPATNSSASGPENIHGKFTQPQLSSTGTDNNGAPTLNSLAAESQTDLNGFLSANPQYRKWADMELNPNQARAIQTRMAQYRQGSGSDTGTPNPVAPSGTGDQESRPSRAAASNQLNPSMGEGSSAQSPRQGAERRIVQNEGNPPLGSGAMVPAQFRSNPQAFAEYLRQQADDLRRRNRLGELIGISSKTAEDRANAFDKRAEQIEKQLGTDVEQTKEQKNVRSGTTKQEEQAKADIKYYDSLHHGHTGTGFIAAQQKQNIDVLRQVLNSKSFVPGAGGDLALQFQRWAAQLNIDPTAAAPREVFNQVAARILADQFSGMKTMAAETGEAGARVFKSMLDIEEKANITHEDSEEGVRKKLDFLDKAGDLFKKWADKADQYKIDHGGLDAKFEKQMRDDISKARIDLKLPQTKPTSTGTPTSPGGWREIAPGVRIREKPNMSDRT